MASEERTRALIEGAGLTPVRMEEVPVRFAFRDLDDYESWAMEVGGTLAPVLRGLSEAERKSLKAELADAFTPFAAGEGRYELPGVALCAVAS